MPRFKLADQEIKDLASYIHTQKKLAESQKGGRRGVEVADLQTGQRRRRQQNISMGRGSARVAIRRRAIWPELVRA